MLSHFPDKRQELRQYERRLSIIPYGSIYSLQIYTNLVAWEEFLYRYYLVHENKKTRKSFAGYFPKRGKKKPEISVFADEAAREDDILII